MGGVGNGRHIKNTGEVILHSHNQTTRVAGKFRANSFLLSVSRLQSSGLVYMGGDSGSEGHGFESQHHMDIFTYICCKKFNV